MSLPIASVSAATALPAMNIRPHGHGHKKDADSVTDPSSSTAAQTPAGSTQNLFGSLLSSLEQVMGAQPATAAASQAGAAAQSTASSVGDAAKSILGTVGSALRLFA
jgi:hypothetical protein